MPHATTAEERIDTGLTALVLAARFHGLPADAQQLRHQFGVPGESFDDTAILRAARHLGLKARAVPSRWERLGETPLPAIARHTDGHYFLIARCDGDKILIQDPLERRPLTLPREIFESAWSGELILLTRRAALPGGTGKFGLRWFIPALVKHRKLFGEVLLASLFLQLFALVTPLFFQVVIDKVLVHKGLTTLDVLAFGLIAIALFDALLGGLRTYLFSHTTNRVDVTLVPPRLNIGNISAPQMRSGKAPSTGQGHPLDKDGNAA